jgi:hypothetical protein
MVSFEVYTRKLPAWYLYTNIIVLLDSAKYDKCVCFRCFYKLVIIIVGCAVFVLRSLRSCWSCSTFSIAYIFICFIVVDNNEWIASDGYTI